MRRRELLSRIVTLPAAAALASCAKSGPATLAKVPEAAPLKPGEAPRIIVDDITGRQLQRQLQWPPKSTTAYTKEEATAVFEPMPAKPTLIDFFKRRFIISQHMYRTGRWAMNQKLPEPIVLACLLHDVGQSIARPDHGYWGAELVRPYVPAETAWAIQYHQPLRFFADQANGYHGPPEFYKTLFGADAEPDPYIQTAYGYARKHEWYMSARLVTIADQQTPEAKNIYTGDKKPEILEPEMFTDVIGRHFKTPPEGLGYDNSPVAHMWRTLINPTRLL